MEKRPGEEHGIVLLQKVGWPMEPAATNTERNESGHRGH
jgi:hypothetical protein